jgi:hypothetical protein
MHFKRGATVDRPGQRGDCPLTPHPYPSLRRRPRGGASYCYTVRRRTAKIENVENLILEHLSAMRGDISALRDDSREVKSRLTSLETAVVGMRREIADLYTDLVG